MIEVVCFASLMINYNNVLYITELCTAHTVLFTDADDDVADDALVGWVDVDGVAGFNEDAGDRPVYGGDSVEKGVVVKSLFSCEEW